MASNNYIKQKNLKFRNEVINQSHALGIKVRPVWRPLHKSKYLKNMPKMKLETTLNLENRIINLPSSPNILSKIS